MITKSLKKIFESESITGILIFIAATTALFLANSQNSQIYFQFFKTPLPLTINFLQIHQDLSLKDWINNALMTLFFFLIGLELKKEILIGELSEKKKLILPTFAALGGVIFPALIFFFCNFNHPENLRGFAIPTATDIAFAYGMICLFGKKISSSLKVFIVALAVLDDMFAILIIAIFYTKDLQIFYLFLATIPLFGLLILNLRRSNKISLYLILGVLLWLMILKSGVHSTLSGVLLALFIPFEIDSQKLLENLAHKISPLVNFLILPIFAFANSGVEITKFSYNFFLQPLTSGIILSLFFGKQIGVMLFSFLAIKLKFASLPSSAKQSVTWLQFYAVAIFTGIGFTMSLFIGELSFVQNNAFDTPREIMLDGIKIGILIGSILSIFYGSCITFVSIKTANRKL